jgi:hypothetical protein
MPIAQCMSCGDGICERHAKWHEDGYICSKCANRIGWKEYGASERRIALPERHWEPPVEEKTEETEEVPPSTFQMQPEGGDAQ